LLLLDLATTEGRHRTLARQFGVSPADAGVELLNRIGSRIAEAWRGEVGGGRF
jgi:hypothetical protein